MDFSINLGIIYKSVKGISHYESVTHRRLTPGITRTLRNLQERRAEGTTGASRINPQFIIDTHLNAYLC
jgi:hypothetical protein